MTLQDFVATYNNQPIDVDREYGDQCWDLVELYAEEVLNIPKGPWAITLNSDGSEDSGQAKNAWLYFDNNPNLVEHFDKVPAGQEQAGDIMVDAAHPYDPEGHIYICLGDGMVFEQNANPDGSPAHTYARPRTYLLGSLRVKENDMTMTEADARAVLYLNGWTDQDIKNANPIPDMVGRTLGDFVAYVQGAPDNNPFKWNVGKAQHYDADIAAAKASGAATLKPGIYEVKG